MPASAAIQHPSSSLKDGGGMGNDLDMPVLCRSLYGQAVSHDRHLQGIAPEWQHPARDS